MNILQNPNTLTLNIPLYASRVAAGFPSPADDYVEAELDLNSYLISSPSSTFLARLTSHTSLVEGVKKGSILIVDRSLTPTHNKIVVAVSEGNFLLRRIKLNNGPKILVTDDKRSIPIFVDQDTYIWGVVKTIITKLQ